MRSKVKGLSLCVLLRHGERKTNRQHGLRALRGKGIK